MSRTLLTLLLTFSAAGAETKEVVWNPLVKQEVEPDTLFLLDVDAELRLKPGEGGLIPTNDPRSDEWIKVRPCEGKFRKGIRGLQRPYGYLWMPSIGFMNAAEFTVEFWVKGDRPWAEMQDQPPLVLWDEGGGCRLDWNIVGQRLMAGWKSNQSPLGPQSAGVSYDLAKNPIAAGRWVQLAATFKEGTVRFYLDGQPIGEKAGLVAPQIWSDHSRGDGLSICGGYGRGAHELAVSDLRISRYARTPGAKTVVRGDNTLIVRLDKPTGGQVRQTLLGGLHYLGGPKTEAMAKGVVKVLRTDKLLVATPIKAGEPDEAHPARGVSGRYAYDWQVCDRTFDYFQRLDITPYISIDATPQILGGRCAPFSGDKLQRGLSGWSEFPTEVPNDLEAFGTIVRDLIHHVVVERKHVVPYWGVWNEPDGTSFWNNNLDDYLRLYDVCARAVKAVDPKLKVGGPETGDYNRRWIEALIKHCAEGQVPLDFISWHYYQSTVAEIATVRAEVDYWCGKYGRPKVELINGEWCWQIHNFPKTGYYPWSTRNYYLNDWHAAFTAASLIEMQKQGVVYAIYTNPVAEAGGAGFNASGLMSPEHPWANLNVYRLWTKLAPDLVETTYDGRPGVFAQASRDAQGRVTLLLAHLRYRKDVAAELTVSLRGAPLPAGAKLTAYLIDDQHSNWHDAGPEHGELETVPPPRLNRGELTVTLPPRSAYLLTIEP